MTGPRKENNPTKAWDGTEPGHLSNHDGSQAAVILVPVPSPSPSSRPTHQGWSHGMGKGRFILASRVAHPSLEWLGRETGEVFSG